MPDEWKTPFWFFKLYLIEFTVYCLFQLIVLQHETYLNLCWKFHTPWREAPKLIPYCPRPPTIFTLFHDHNRVPCSKIQLSYMTSQRHSKPKQHYIAIKIINQMIWCIANTFLLSSVVSDNCPRDTLLFRWCLHFWWHCHSLWFCFRSHDIIRWCWSRRHCHCGYSWRCSCISLWYWCSVWLTSGRVGRLHRCSLWRWLRKLFLWCFTSQIVFMKTYTYLMFPWASHLEVLQVDLVWQTAVFVHVQQSQTPALRPLLHSSNVSHLHHWITPTYLGSGVGCWCRFRNVFRWSWSCSHRCSSICCR